MVVLVAIIALARKVVVLKIENLPGDTVLGMGVLIIALAASYYLIKKSGLMVWQIGEVVDGKEQETIVKLKKKKNKGKEVNTI